jgi:hypothetical protein
VPDHVTNGWDVWKAIADGLFNWPFMGLIALILLRTFDTKLLSQLMLALVRRVPTAAEGDAPASQKRPEPEDESP